MATFGLDNTLTKKLKMELDVENIRRDQFTDFFLLPQLNAIYQHCGEQLKTSVVAKLNSSAYGPKPPIEIEVPKSIRVSTRSLPIVGPNYFRPGSVLLPEDRVVYHFIAQEAAAIIENSLNRKAVYSNKPLAKKGEGFVSPAQQWKALKDAFEAQIKSGNYTIAFKCDVSQYFFSINQHELVNQLEHQGFQAEMVKFSEKFLSGLTLDRSSRGILQGLYGSDVLGNGYLCSIDEFITEFGHTHFRYVDDIYILFKTADEFRVFFPAFVKRLRNYDLSLNESKTFATPPIKLLREETELDKAIQKAKKEAAEKLTNYEEVEIHDGPYGESMTALVEAQADDAEVDLTATTAVFEELDNFKGEERHRAESFCLAFFRRAGDSIAVDYVAKRWLRHPDRAKEYAVYLFRFVGDDDKRHIIDAMILSGSSTMIDYQWSWAAILMRRFRSISDELLNKCYNVLIDGSKNEVVRSLMIYTVCRHGSPKRKKEIRDNYASFPLLVQLAIIHCGKYFTSGERSALMKTAEAHGDLQALMCEAARIEIKAKSAKSS